MRSKHLLLMLLLALMAPWAAMAQTLTVHDGTTTNSYVPFYGFYADEDQTNQMIYPATELADMKGKAITQMVFYWQEGGYNYGNYYGVGTWTVSLGETTATTLSGLDNTTTLTPVFTGVLDEAGGLFDNTAYTLTITFDDPYVYGESNLLVQFDHTGTGEYEYYVFKGETVTGASYSYNSQRDFLPKTTFTYETPSACSKPTGLTVNSKTNETATISWTSEASNFNIQYRKITEPTWNTRTSTSTSYTITGLESGTEYEVQVQANCGGGSLSNWTTSKNFTTNLCADADMCEISYVLTGGYYDDYFDEWYGWNGAKINVVDHETGIIVSTLTLANSDPQSGISGSLSLCDGESIDFVWVAGQWGGWYDNYCEYTFLDVNGEEIFSGEGALSSTVNYSMSCTIVTCLKPTGLTVNSKTNETATISWTSEASNFNIQYRKITEPTWNTGTSTSTSYTITGLDSGTEYEVQVQANCGGGDLSDWTTSKNFTTNFCTDADMCEIIFALTDSYGDSWNGAYIDVVDVATSTSLAHMTNQNLNGTTGSGENELNTLTLAVCDGREIQFVWHSGSYDSECSYVVTNVNGDEIFSGSGAMSASVNYTMSCPSCINPTNLAETQVGTTSAMLSWEGENDSYVLQYRTAAYDMNMSVWEQQGDDIEAPGTFTQLSFDLSAYSGTGYIAIRHYACSGQWQMSIDDIVVTNADNETVFEEDFEGGTFPATLTNLDYDNDGRSWQIANFGDETYQHGDYCAMSASYSYGDLYPDNWLIIPNVALGGTLTFYVGSTDPDWPENFGVFVATQSYEGAEAGAWSADIPVTTLSHKLTGLTASTAYDWQVKGICGTEETGWASSSFTTIAEGFKTFVTAGDWNNAENWFPEGVPTTTDEVSITKAANIPAGVLAQAKKATIETGGSITIKDGGQLKQGSATLKVTMEKGITGYGESTNKDHYYFIATPLTGTTKIGYNSGWNYVANLGVGDYDFYAFDASEVTEEWQNFEASSFEMYPGAGYLYANKADKTLQFVGTVKGTNNPTTINYTYDGESTDPFNGWALVGNPYTCNAYINYVDGDNNPLAADFYTLNAAGNAYVLSESSVALPPLTGAFINYAATGRVQFATEAPSSSSPRMLNMTLSQNQGSIDQARVRFGQGHNLKHLSFRENSSKLYMPVEGNDYAVVYAEPQGEMPVSFKAENNGSYTLSFSNENVEFGYLHLIDNMTGEDVNLLETPSYSFEAKTTDYASRFKLVFSTGNGVNEESFAFISDGNIILNGEGMLQVVDVMGRIMMQEENATSVSTSGMTPGVYVLRLINGDSVRTQKIVVK